MFATHQPLIGNYAARGPKETYHVLRFVQATINQRFVEVPTIIDQLDKHGTSKMLSGARRNAINFYAKEQHAIFTMLHDPQTSDTQKLISCVMLPWFGIVKAGFILQLIHGTVGCMDTHNIRAYGLDKSVLRSACSATLLQTRVEAYILLCQRYGTARLWDNWCAMVAEKYPARFTGAEHVSQLHVDCIVREASLSV